MREFVCLCVCEREREVVVGVKQGDFVPVFGAIFIKGSVLAADGFLHLPCRNRNMQLL